MFEMQSVLQGPVSPRRQMAAMAAFTHLAAATVLLVALAWRIESVEPPSFFAEALLPVAFLPAEWSAPLATPARTPAAAPAAKTPTVVQPDEVPDVVPTASSALDAEPLEPLATPGAASGSGAAAATASGLTDAGGVGNGAGTPLAGAAVVWHAGIVPPQVLYRIDPKYPEIARTARRQGAVVVEAEISTDGSLRSARVVSAPLGFGLEQSALDAIGSWRFAPARYGERPVAVYYRWNILFNLR
ncbi:MAG: energy transducer TonB [Thermoanaerobaculia bacterium]|nr:energy transducer TonB [Thermoanaerobaculia bacterium]